VTLPSLTPSAFSLTGIAVANPGELPLVDGRGKTKRTDRKVLEFTSIIKDVVASDFASIFSQVESFTGSKLQSRTPATLRADGLTVKSYKCHMFGCGCPVVVKVLLDKELRRAEVLSSGAHVHSAAKDTLGMTAAQKVFVTAALAGFTHPDRIHLLILKEEALAPFPTIDAIRNFNKNFGRKIRTKGFNDSLAGFLGFGDAHPFKPAELDTIACIAQEVDPAKGTFRFAFASPRMLRLLLAYKKDGKYFVRCTDGTYKLNCEAYTTLVFGIIDFNHHYHPSAVAVVNSELDDDYEWFYNAVERALVLIDPTYSPSNAAPHLVTMQDYAGAIRNGQMSAMAACLLVLKLLMCWSHMARAFYKKVKPAQNP
jgi:hypothetical protein